MAISVDLGPQLEAVVTDLIENGRYGSKSEVLREGVRLVQEREAKLAALYALIDEGIAEADAGNTILLEEAFAQVEAELDLLLAEPAGCAEPPATIPTGEDPVRCAGASVEGDDVVIVHPR